MPSFIKMDFSELPALIAAFTYGPVSGTIVCLIKNLLHLFSTSTSGIGELSNFLLGAAFVIPAGLLYRRNKTRKGALIGSISGLLLMSAASLITNYYIVYPVYAVMIPMETIIAAYQAILPGVKNLWQALLIFNLPFTFVKGAISVVVTFAIYKRISPIMKGTHKKDRAS